MIRVIRSEAQGSPSRAEEGAASTSQAGLRRAEKQSKPDEKHAGLSKPQQNLRESLGLERS